MGHGGGVEIPDQPRHDNDVALQPQALSLLSHQIGIIGKGTKNKPLRPEELGVVILPRLADEPDWDAIEDGDPRY